MSRKVKSVESSNVIVFTCHETEANSTNTREVPFTRVELATVIQDERVPPSAKISMLPDWEGDAGELGGEHYIHSITYYADVNRLMFEMAYGAKSSADDMDAGAGWYSDVDE